MLRQSFPAAKPNIARTHSGNQWSDDAFFRYVERKLIESRAEIHIDNIQTVFTAILTHGTPAGNA